MKILIVEDEAILGKVIQEKLKNEGFETRIAVNGEEGVRQAREFMPDLILLDLILPKRNGFEVLTEIKHNPDTQLIPVIVLSNLDQEDDVKKALQLGAIDYLVKAHHPIKEVLEKVKEFVYNKSR